jgi:outer membrane immunogenic protein
MKQALFAAVSVIALAGTAGAADLPRRMPAPEYIAPAFSWNGFYIGGHTGVAVGKTSTSNNAPYGGFDAGGTPLSYNLHPAGIFGGGQLGYNWQRGVYVFGVEADIGYLGLNDSISPAPGNYVAVQYGWYGTITGRLGLAMYDRLLTYVKGGAAVASITNSAGALTGAGVVDPTDYSETKKTRWGWTVGSGFEYALNQTWSVKSEYMYMNFGKFNATNLDGDTFTHKNQVHSLKVGLNYRFGGYNAPVVARY